MRLLHFMVIGALVLAASYVYKIKFDSTLQAERLGKVRAEIRQERDAIALLRAEWARLETPARLQDLAQRFLPLRRVDARQFDDLARLPEKPPGIVQPQTDPIANMIEHTPPDATGSVAPR
ncbi:MAG: hypothetical protein JOZ70_11745 [Pseudolabrys sp.]|nr:hypothetical protein [Pseudolabrys sp.]